MSSETLVIEHTIDDYKSAEKPTWCPGCGDFGVLNAVYNALRVKGYDPKDIVCVSGIGCSSRLPYFMATYGFHSIHGRAIPVTTGIRVANPDLKVLVFGGDGDALAIGAGHFVHGMRRNLDVCYVIMDNSIYGLTKGQTSPTSMIGFTTKTTPKGNAESPINPLLLAITAGATFVARAFSGRPKELADLIVQGVDHHGFAVIDAFSPCPTFNKVNTFKTYREETTDLPPGYDPTDKIAAMTFASSESPIYLGLMYRQERDTFEDHVQSQITGGPADTTKVLTGLFRRFS